MRIDWNLTARPKGPRGRGGDSFFEFISMMNDRIPEKELIASTEKCPFKAFCGNCGIIQVLDHDLDSHYYYFVPNLRSMAGIARAKKADHGATDCPDCKHALFWSSNYHKIHSTHLVLADFARRRIGMKGLLRENVQAQGLPYFCVATHKWKSYSGGIDIAQKLLAGERIQSYWYGTGFRKQAKSTGPAVTKKPKRDRGRFYSKEAEEAIERALREWDD